MPTEKKRSGPQLSVRPSEAKYQADRRRLTEAKNPEVSSKNRPRAHEASLPSSALSSHLGRDRKEHRVHEFNDVKSLQRKSSAPDRAERMQRRKTMGPMDRERREEPTRRSKTSRSTRPEGAHPAKERLPQSP